MKPEMKIPETSVEDNSINMIDISRKTYETNDVETILERYEILSLNGKHIEEGLDHRNLQVATAKNLSGSMN